MVACAFNFGFEEVSGELGDQAFYDVKLYTWLNWIGNYAYYLLATVYFIRSGRFLKKAGKS
jgi:hypothetical protein